MINDMIIVDVACTYMNLYIVYINKTDMIIVDIACIYEFVNCIY
jgi:hypothetical protein